MRMGIWDNAFKLPDPPEATEEEKKLLDVLADKVRARKMGDMAALTLESTKPLHNLGAQGVVFLGPMLNMFFQKEEVSRYVKLLENPKAVAYLVERLGADQKTKS
jgi:hypothetical protein